MNKILNLLKKIIPLKLFKKLQPIYHLFLAKVSAFIYGHPANKMIVVGVTGTSGKSSSCYFTAQILEQAGFKVGMTTTTLFKIGDKEWLNDKKMTMLGRWQTQKLLKQMLKQKCQVAIIESSSQGIQQFRHAGINYDILVFTNLYPEHIEAHGNFENYKHAKGKLFNYLHTCPEKKVNPVAKTIIVNSDDEYAEYFLNFKAGNKIGFTTNNQSRQGSLSGQLTTNDNVDKIINLENLKINLLGDYNQYNVLAGVSVARVLKIDEQKIKSAVAHLKPLPGRLEFIHNDLGIKILIDYAFEPKAVEKLYKTLENVPHERLIHVLGSTGGGKDPATQRDKSRRPILGQLANENCDVVIVTNEDPYDEDPQTIIDQVAEPVDKNKLHKIIDRRQAIKKALELAQPNDLILITGKGAEQKMCLANGKMIDWDDREVVKEELKKI